MAQPATHAPNTRAEKPGHTSIHAASSDPGHCPLLLLLGTALRLLLLLLGSARGCWGSVLAAAV